MPVAKFKIKKAQKPQKQKKTTLASCLSGQIICFEEKKKLFFRTGFMLPGRICKEQRYGTAHLPANRITYDPTSKINNKTKKRQLFRVVFFMAPQVGFEPTTLRLTAECYYR